MCSENKRRTKSTAFWERAVTTCKKPHSLLSETAVEIHPLLTNCALTVQGKLHPLIFEREQWHHVKNHMHCLVHYSDNMESHPLLIKCAVKTHGKPNPLLFERGLWQHVENHIHCLVKQQWQHMEIHPLPIKCDVTIHGKQHPLFYERDQWQLAKITSTAY